MKATTLLMAFLITATALPARAVTQDAPAADKSGIPPRDPAKAPHRCDEAALGKVSDKIKLPPGKAGADSIDRGGEKGNPLCNHEIWNLVERDKSLKTDFDSAFNAVNYQGQVAVLKRADGIFHEIDKQVEAVLARAEEVFRSGARLSILAAKIGDFPTTANPNRQPKDKIKVVSEIQNGEGKLEASEGGPSIAELADAIDDIAQGGEAEDKAAKPPKAAKPATPGKKVQAYFKEIEALRALLEKLKTDARLTPAGLKYATTEIPVQGDRKAVDAAVATVFSIGQNAQKKAEPRGALTGFDWSLVALLSDYHKKVNGVFEKMEAVAAKTDSKTPGALKKKLELLAKDKRIKGVSGQITTGVLGAGGLDPAVDPANLPADQQQFVAGARTIKVEGDGGNANVTYTPVGRKPKSVPVNLDDPADVQRTAQEVATDLAGGDEKLARLKAAKTAVGGGGHGQNDKPGPGDLAGPKPVTGLESGCGKGKTLDDYKKGKLEELRGKNGKQSAARTKLLEEYNKKYKDAEDAYKASLPRRGDFESEAEYNNRAEVKTAKRKKAEAEAAADAWYQAELDKLGSQEQQAADYAQSQKDAVEGADKQIRTQVKYRVAQLRKEFVEKDYQGIEAGMAKEYVEPKEWVRDVTPALVTKYFDAYWPVGEVDPYTKYLEWCVPQVRVENEDDTERCVGKLLAYYLKDLHHQKYTLPAPAEPSGPSTGDKAKQFQKAQRLKECQKMKAANKPLPEDCKALLGGQ